MILEKQSLSAQDQRILRALDRAAGDLRRGEAVFVFDGSSGVAVGSDGARPPGDTPGLLIFSLDHADADTLAMVQQQGSTPGQLLLTGPRAQALGLASDKGAGIAVTLPPSASLDWAMFLAIASWDERERLSLSHRGLDAAGSAALRLAKLAPCLPALLAREVTLDAADGLLPGVLPVRAQDTDRFHHLQALSLRRLGTTPVPLEGLGTVQFHLFRSSDGHEDHLAVEVGERPAPKPAASAASEAAPLVRLHSACLTGDIFHSRKCDCGQQLSTALNEMKEAGHGILLYLAQEGRNIGLSNKLRAYLLQDAGLDTVDANRALGYADDERDYEIAARMLEGLGYSSVRLMTNNPHKIAALAEAGVAVDEQVPLIVGVSTDNRKYLQTKAKRSGHILPDTALEALEGTLKKS